MSDQEVQISTSKAKIFAFVSTVMLVFLIADPFGTKESNTHDEEKKTAVELENAIAVARGGIKKFATPIPSKPRRSSLDGSTSTENEVEEDADAVEDGANNSTSTDGEDENPGEAADDDGNINAEADGGKEAIKKKLQGRRGGKAPRQRTNSRVAWTDAERASQIRANPVMAVKEFIDGQPSLDIGSLTDSDPNENALGWYPNPEETCTEPFHSTMTEYCRVNNESDPMCSYNCASQRKGLWKEPLTLERISTSYQKVLKRMRDAKTRSESKCDLAYFARRFVKTPKVTPGSNGGAVVAPDHVNKTQTSTSYLIPDEVDPALKPEFADGLLKAIGECPLEQFNQVELLALFYRIGYGRPILFSGDSMMRHIFLRLVMFLRGKSVVAGRPFQCNAVYVVGETGDVLLRMHDSLRWDLKAINSVGRRRVTILFGWDPYMQASVLPKLMRQSRPAIVVMGFFYWWDFQRPKDILPILTYMGRWLENEGPIRGRGRLGGRGRGGATQDPAATVAQTRRLVLITCPPMKKTHRYGVLRKITQRNDLMELWRHQMLLRAWRRDQSQKNKETAEFGSQTGTMAPPTEKQLASTAMGKRIMLVDYEAFSFWRRYPLVDYLHYQCSFVVRCLNSKTMDLRRPWSAMGKPCNRTAVWWKGVTTAIGTHQDYASCSDRMNRINNEMMIHQLAASTFELGDAQ